MPGEILLLVPMRTMSYGLFHPKRCSLIRKVEGKKLNGPNDLWIGKRGIYFTDPYYRRNYWAHRTGNKEQKCIIFPKGLISLLQLLQSW